MDLPTGEFRCLKVPCAPPIHQQPPATTHTHPHTHTPTQTTFTTTTPDPTHLFTLSGAFALLRMNVIQSRYPTGCHLFRLASFRESGARRNGPACLPQVSRLHGSLVSFLEPNHMLWHGPSPGYVSLHLLKDASVPVASTVPAVMKQAPPHPHPHPAHRPGPSAFRFPRGRSPEG